MRTATPASFRCMKVTPVPAILLTVQEYKFIFDDSVWAGGGFAVLKLLLGLLNYSRPNPLG